MSRKQFIAILVVLLALGGAAAWVKWSDDTQWKQTNERVGKPLVSNIKVANVAEVRISGTAGVTTLKQVADGWNVAERSDFPADVERIRDLILKIIDLRVAQAEALAPATRARYGLAEPKAPDTPDAATIVELRSKDGKALARLQLGRVIKKSVEQQTQQGQTVTREVPSGRFVVGAETDTVVTVNDPLAQADADPKSWLIKEIVRVERPVGMTSTQGGKPRWAFARENDTVLWKFAGSSEALDQQKAQDIANVLYSVNLVDVADPAKVSMGPNDKPIMVKMKTMDGYTYEVQLGEKTDKDLYPFKFSVALEEPKPRVAPKGESAEDKAKEDKAYEERVKSIKDKFARENKLAAWTYLVSKTVAEPILR